MVNHAMKCHWCFKKLELVNLYKNGKFVRDIKRYECPDSHIEIEIKNNEILDFSCFFFKNDYTGSIRYKLQKINNDIYLYRRVLEKSGGYRQVMTLSNPPPLEISNDIPQVNRLYDRLKKLVIFT